MKIKLNTLIISILFLIPLFLKSQNENQETKQEVKGRIMDQTSGEPLVGASVTYDKGKGTTTDINGNFSFWLPDGDYKLTISYVGYSPITQKISVKGQPVVINTVNLKNESALNEVEVVADIARSRETPIAFSDMDVKQISREQGANDVTMLMNSMPGVYASQQGGGAGDSRITIRGFDQRYIGVLVDGVPMNDMENGRVFWSNWSGLGAVTNKIQVQRGLGASKLAIPAVGGVMNFITKSIESEKSVVVRNDMGTNNYRSISVGYNSGLIKNRLGFSIAGGYTGGDGYIDQTWQKTWNYFAKVSFKINARSHIFFSVNGAPQSHGQRSFAINMAYHDEKFAKAQGINVDSIYALNKYTTANIRDRGTTYSPDWGYLNGKATAVKINYFHKPLFNLSYFLTINSRMSFSNILYASFGKGGATTLNSFPAYDYSGSGQFQLQSAYDANINNITNPSGKLIPDERPSLTYMYSSVNNHKWVGILPTLKYKITSKTDFLGGLDARYYIGTHYQTPYNLLGGDYAVMVSGKNLNLAPYAKDPYPYIKKPGDKMNYYNDSRISWLGLFGQVEHKMDRLTTFLTVTGNQNGYQYVNYFGKKDIELSKSNRIHNAVGYGDTLYSDGNNYGVKANGVQLSHNNDGSITFFDNLSQKNVTINQNYTAYNNNSSEAKTNTSKIKYFNGYTAKGGLNYQLDQNHNVFVNGGYMSLVPKFNNVFDNNGNQLEHVRNQVITSLELGYGIHYKQIAVNVNGYITKWDNRPADFISSSYDTLKRMTVNYNIAGMDAFLKGVEFDMTYSPIKSIDIRVFGAFADWKWNSQGTSYAYSDQGTPLDTIVFDAKGIPIGNAPQRQLGGSIKFEPLRNTYIKIQYIHFDKMYAQFDPSNLKVEGKGPSAKDYRGYSSWQMPGYGICDLYAGYGIRSDKTSIDLMVTLNNVFNTVYMTDAFFTSTVKPNNYNALNTVGWMGLGRRINIGIKVSF